MDFATRLASPKARLYPCRFRAWLTTLDVVSRAAVIEAMKNTAWSDDSLLLELESEGCDVGASTLRNHRAGLCKGCGRA